MNLKVKYGFVAVVILSTLIFACGQGENGKSISRSEYGKRDGTPVRVDVGNIETWIKLISDQKVSVHLSSIRQVENGDILAVGVYRRSNPSKESAYITRLDPHGQQLWSKMISKSAAFWAVDGTAADDGGYIILGQISPWEKDKEIIRNVTVFRTDSTGQILWEKNITGGSDEEIGAALVATADGNYVVSGQVTSIDKGSLSTYLAKISPEGDLLWKKTYKDIGARMGIGLVPDAEGGCTATSLVTDTEPHANTDALIFKIDTDGNVLWSNTIGGDDEDEVYSIADTRDGGYIISGKTRSIGAGDFDMWIAKLDSSADLVWQNAFGTDKDEAGLSAVQTKDGNYILIGTSRWYADGQLHMIGTKVDQQGNWMWDHIYKPGNMEQSRMILATDDGGAILGGTSQPEHSAYVRMMIIKIDPNGDFKGDNTAQP